MARSAYRAGASPARLVIALSVAAVLAVFLLYTSIAGGGNPSLAPSELAGRTGEVQLAGVVVGPVTGDYSGSVPDLFKVGRHVVVDGALRRGTFVAVPGSLITKCPSKYAPKQSGDSA